MTALKDRAQLTDFRAFAARQTGRRVRIENLVSRMRGLRSETKTQLKSRMAEGADAGELSALRRDLERCRRRVDRSSCLLARAKRREWEAGEVLRLVAGKKARMPSAERVQLEKALVRARRAIVATVSRDGMEAGANLQPQTVMKLGAKPTTVSFVVRDTDDREEVLDVAVLRVPDTSVLAGFLSRGQLEPEHGAAAERFVTLGDLALAPLGIAKMAFSPPKGGGLTEEERLVRARAVAAAWKKVQSTILRPKEFLVLNAILRNGESLQQAGRAAGFSRDKNRQIERATVHLEYGLEALVGAWGLRAGGGAAKKDA